jgi:hypothetical protein
MGTKVNVRGLTDVAVEISQLCPKMYVPAAYDNDWNIANDWYIGCIITHNDEECDILVTFMERKGQDILTFSWPQREGRCHIPLVHVLCTVPVPWKKWMIVKT